MFPSPLSRMARLTLSWDGIGNLPRRVSLTLTDALTSEKIALGSRSSYKFSAKAGETRSFRIASETGVSLPLTILNLSATRHPRRQRFGRQLPVCRHAGGGRDD